MLEEAKKYFELGWTVIPQVWGDVKPIVKVSDYFYKHEFPESSFNGRTNIAVVCGETSNLIVLDIDNCDHEFFEKLKPMMRGLVTPQSKSNKGYHIFFKYSEEFKDKLQYKDAGVNIFDVQTNKTLITLPPSLHKNGTYNYKWLKDPFTTPIIDMPDNIKELIFSYIKLIVKPPTKRHDRVDLLSRLKEIPILEVASRLGIEYDKDHKANCFVPGHKDTHKSLSFDAQKNYFHCFGCSDNSGDTLKLVQNYKDYDFKQAMAWLNYEFFRVDIVANTKVDVTKTIKQFSDQDALFEFILSKVSPVNFEQQAMSNGAAVPKTGLSFKTKKYFVVANLIEILKAEGYPLAYNELQTIYMYNGSYWMKLFDNKLKKFITDVAHKMGIVVSDAYETKNSKDLYEQLLTLTYRETNRNKDFIEINLNNGIVEFKDGVFIKKPFSAESFFTYKLGFDYNPSAQCPMFHKYLDKVLPDKDDQKTLQEFVGYIFTKNSFLKLEKTMFLYGTGHTGKSVFYDILLGLLGTENVSKNNLTDLSNDVHRADISGKLLNYCTESGKNTDNEFFKQMASGETVKARLLYVGSIEITDMPRFIFNTNKLPTNVDHDESFFRRFIIMHFNQIITEKEKDIHLANKIKKEELSGIFNWALVGLTRLVKNNAFTVSQRQRLLMCEYKENTDNVFMFTNSDDMPEDFVLGLDEGVNGNSLYSTYKSYCLSYGYKPVGLISFFNRLEQLGKYEKVKIKKIVHIRLKKDDIAQELENILKE